MNGLFPATVFDKHPKFEIFRAIKIKVVVFWVM